MTLNMIDIHQSTLYSKFITKIGWIVENVDGVNIFIKKLPLISPVIKIQRSDKLLDSQKLKLLMQKYHARSISVELAVIASPKDVAISNFEFVKSPFLPTKTIHIDLTPEISKIFDSFSPAKRKAIRRAQNLGVEICESNDIEDFIKLKNSSAGFLGFLTTQTLKPLWKTFAPDNAFILLASINRHPETINKCHPELVSGSNSKTGSRNEFGMTIEAGVLILIWQNTAYYWMASANNEGKKSFAPTFLVWESLKKAKSMGAINFDFEGIYDERYPKLNTDWLGFSKFKSGFGGREIYFPQPFKITNSNYNNP